MTINFVLDILIFSHSFYFLYLFLCYLQIISLHTKMWWNWLYVAWIRSSEKCFTLSWQQSWILFDRWLPNLIVNFKFPLNECQNMIMTVELFKANLTMILTYIITIMNSRLYIMKYHLLKKYLQWIKLIIKY